MLSAITCSLEDTENEAVAERFLERHPNFSRLGLEERLESPLDEFVQGRGLWRILTGGDHDGFTVHVFCHSRSAA